MRIIIWFYIILSIYSCQSEKSIIGKWYSSDFGVLDIRHDSILCFLPHASEPEVWKFNNSLKLYKYEGYRFYRCKVDTTVYFSVNLIDNSRIDLRSQSDCLFNNLFTGTQILHRIPKFQNIKFDDLKIKVFTDNVWKEKRFTFDEILNMHIENSEWSLNEQLWLLFASGIDHKTEGNIFIYKIELELNSENNRFSKTVTTYPNPIYFRQIMDSLLINVINSQ